MKKGPNDASGIVWALGVFFFKFFFSILLTTKAHSSQRRPPKANAGPRKPTAANAGPQKPTAANDGPRRPTQAHESPQQPTQANAGPPSRALVFFLFSFFFCFHPEMRLRPPFFTCFFSFLFSFSFSFSFHCPGLEMHLGPSFFVSFLFSFNVYSMYIN